MIIEMLGHKIAEYKIIKRRSCIKKYYKQIWIESNEFHKFKEECKNGKNNNIQGKVK